MIIIDKGPGAAAVNIPLNGYTDTPQILAISARSTADNSEASMIIEDWSITQNNGVKGAFVTVFLILPEDMALGEYEYALTADGQVVSSGILQVVENGEAPAQYNANDDYKQYGE